MVPPKENAYMARFSAAIKPTTPEKPSPPAKTPAPKTAEEVQKRIDLAIPFLEKLKKEVATIDDATAKLKRINDMQQTLISGTGEAMNLSGAMADLWDSVQPMMSQMSIETKEQDAFIRAAKNLGEEEIGLLAFNIDDLQTGHDSMNKGKGVDLDQVKREGGGQGS